MLTPSCINAQVLKAAQGKVFEANCIFAGVCAPQVFVYSPGMYSSSNQDFVRGTVSSFYEMFKQVGRLPTYHNTCAQKKAPCTLSHKHNNSNIC